METQALACWIFTHQNVHDASEENAQDALVRTPLIATRVEQDAWKKHRLRNCSRMHQNGRTRGRLGA